MTWVLAAAIPFGYGAIVSDVRVTWDDGRISHDILQKVYPAGPMMMAAFAGSVEIGFQLVGDLHRSLQLPPGRIWEPKAAAWHWRRRGRRMFRNAPAALQTLGASIVLVGISPEKNGPFQFARCIRMTAPTFDLEILPPLIWASIGTGSQHRSAEDYTREFPKHFWDFYFKTEGMNPGGVASAVASTVATSLEQTPMATVSNILQVGTVWPKEHRIKNLKRQRHGPAWTSETLVDPIPGELLTSWTEFSRFAASEELEAAAAST
jgi:hypothetical protein